MHRKHEIEQGGRPLQELPRYWLVSRVRDLFVSTCHCIDEGIRHWRDMRSDELPLCSPPPRPSSPCFPRPPVRLKTIRSSDSCSSAWPSFCPTSISLEILITCKLIRRSFSVAQDCGKSLDPLAGVPPAKTLSSKGKLSVSLDHQNGTGCVFLWEGHGERFCYVSIPVTRIVHGIAWPHILLVVCAVCVSCENTK